MVEGSEKYCKQKKRNNHIDGENEVRNILAPSWCPKKKH